MAQYFTEESSIPHFLYSSSKSAFLWLIVRVYLGYEWFTAGWEKIHNPAWVGDSAGVALTGFIKGALAKTAEFCKPNNRRCAHPWAVCGLVRLLWFIYESQFSARGHRFCKSDMDNIGSISRSRVASCGILGTRPVRSADNF
ncbi:MAG: DoxX protein [Candidatus Kaiserbacteria bacterium GW2011_GWA2_49_19]|uniref:DoxX protein n=1 Tax=Candidatus Kaiserbacteria bacterium GW2011_GWA2_49_19 TaxID=1618669 RepID=A0A0G1VNY9_9BACT|nr:MAG: DoxX protein [Candidatus Kaiserbacteria bacterium GW2011_GWA2_49_19]